MIRVSVALLDKQPVELDDEEPVEFLDEEFNGQYEFVSPVRYKLLARKVSGSVLVTGSCSTEICGVCGRCLDEVTMPVESEFSQLYPIEGTGDFLDLSEDVRSEVLLAAPLNLLCSPDCPGLCPHCGANLKREKCSCTKKHDAVGSSVWDVMAGGGKKD
ncbi:MAG: DUF177 domain-containing protein [Victivallaceae bacterium]|nr:DUF177 domain-containing protein [Victivallaceae bacterium]